MTHQSDKLHDPTVYVEAGLFVMEYVLILVAQLRILGLYTILPSGLAHNRPDQRTPRHTFRITMYQINECFCQHNVHFNTLSHLLCYDNNLVLAQHAITTITHATPVRTRHRLSYIISAWLAHTTVYYQTRHTNTTISPTYQRVILFQKIDSQYHVVLQPIEYIQLRWYCNLAVSSLRHKCQIQQTYIIS